MLKQTSLVFTALVALGAGCSLINAYDDVVSSGGGGTGAQGGAGTGGSTTSTMATTTSTTSTGMDGGGGMGGMAPQYACVPFGNPVDILSKADLNNSTNIGEDVLVAFDNDGYTHVFLVDYGAQQIIARTVRDENLGPLVKFPQAPDGNYRRPFQIFSYPDRVRMLADVQGDFRLLEFPKSGNELFPNPPASYPVPAPAACTAATAQPQHMWGSVDGGILHVLGQCSTGMNQVTVFGSRFEANTVAFTYSGDEDDPAITPRQYVNINGTHVILTTSESPADPMYEMRLRIGNDNQVTQNSFPIDIQMDKHTFPFSLTRGAGATPSVFALFAALDPTTPSFTPATLYSGIIEGMDVGMLSNNPGSLVSPAIQFPNQSSILFISPPNEAFAQRYASAGIDIFNPTKSNVFMQWWDQDGALLANSSVHEIADPNAAGRHTFAAAGRGNQVLYFVVWVVKDLDNQFYVQGTRASCDVVAQ